MKKILLIFAVFISFISCSPDEEKTNVHFELLAVQTVEMPTTFSKNVENPIKINFKLPTNCHGFDGFFYERKDFTRTVAVESYVLQQNNCEALTNTTAQQILKFKPTEVGTYLFKFWKGKDTNGADVFEEISVVVQ